MSQTGVDVEKFMEKLCHGRTPDIQRLRIIVRECGRDLVEGVKWNAPSYQYQGQDLVTMRLHPGERLELILHRGAAKRAGEVRIDDPAGLVEWVGPDRGRIQFLAPTDVERQAEEAARLVVAWIDANTADRA